MRRRALAAVFAFFAITLASISARADSIAFDGQSGDAYSYGADSTIAIAPGQTVVFSGLSGVTSASSTDDILAASVTSTGVTFTNTSSLTYQLVAGSSDFFTIDSTAIAGSITFNADSGAYTGSVEGPAAVASSIVFDGQSGDAYSYGADSTIAIAPGQTVVFSGLGGVTSASSTDDILAASVTSTGVTFTNTSSLTYQLVAGSNDFFNIDSTAAGGTITYNADDGAYTGSVEGPAAAVTPEPSSIALLTTGLLGIAGVLRKRLA